MVGGGLSLRVVLCLAFVLCLALPQLPAQVSDSASPANSAPTDGQSANPQDAQSEQRETPPAQNDSTAPATKPTGENFIQPGPALQQTPPLPGQQPKRILGIMPNFRAVSAGATPPGQAMELIDRCWPAQEVALRFVTELGVQKLQLA